MAADEMQELRIARKSAPLRVLICDDDQASREDLRDRCAAVFTKLGARADFDLFGRCADIAEETLRRCGLALLDIDFEGESQSGIDLARRLRRVNGSAPILFITNFIEYAPEGYEVQAFRYILKRDLDTVLGRYLMQALEQLSGAKEVLQLQSRGETTELPLEQILYLEVQGHSVSVFAEDGQTYTVGATLSSFEQQLESHGFLRAHKSYLVNMRHIKKFQCRELTLDNGAVLRVSEKSYAEQKRKYLLWKGWQS